MSAEVPTAQVFEVRTYPDLNALGNLLSGQPLSVCLLDVTTQRDTALSLIREIQRLAPKLPVVALLASDAPDLILASLRQGAAEFLVHPFHKEQMDTVVTRVIAAYPDLMPSMEDGRVVVVAPAKGACGASTIAVNLAFQKKKLGAKRLLLADLDALTGIASFLLKIRTPYSFLDALKRGPQLDADIWKGLVHSQDGIDVLVGPEVISEPLYALNDPRPLLDFARALYDVVIVDAASVYGEWNVKLAQSADDLLLVVQADAPSVKGAQRAIRYLELNHVTPPRVKPVLNRYRNEYGVGPEVVQAALGVAPVATLPADYEVIQKSLIEGRPAPPGTPFHKGISNLAGALLGHAETQPAEPAPLTPAKPGGLAGLIGLFTRKEVKTKA
jgi:pilus assembly protein CpaE